MSKFNYLLLMLCLFPFIVYGQNENCCLGRECVKKNVDIVMKVVPPACSLSSDYIEIETFNHTDFRLNCGAFYRFQQFVSGTWKNIEWGNMPWEASIYYIYPHKSRRFKCYLYKEKHDYTPGRYRILKTFTMEKEIYQDYEVAAEFTLE